MKPRLLGCLQLLRPANVQPQDVGLLLVKQSRALLEHPSVPSNTDSFTETSPAFVEVLMNMPVAVALDLFPEAPMISYGLASNGITNAFFRAW